MSEADSISFTSEELREIENSNIYQMNLLYGQDVQTLTDSEIQLSIALEHAMRETFPALEYAFKEKFQDIHEASVMEGHINTISYEEYVQSEMPKTNNETRNSQHCHYEIL